MDPAPTFYIERDGAALAYQVVGDGPVDVLYFNELPLHLDLFWTDPHMHHALERDALYSRAIHVQRRGFGLSDQIAYTPTIEQQADDLRAVMDAVGVERAALVGMWGTSAPVAMVAAQSPERVSGLVLYSPVVFGLAALEDRHGWEAADVENVFDGLRRAFAEWGTGRLIGELDPAIDTAFNRRLVGMLERSSATPAAAASYLESLLELDARDVLRSVQVPTRVLWSPTNSLPEAYGRYVASLIPSATFHLLLQTPPGTTLGQSLIPTMEHLEEVATGSSHQAEAERYLGTVLFTDLVSSTELLAAVGDVAYQDLRAAHERQIRLVVEDAGGELISVTGDGTLSVFDGPTKAVRVAEAICRQADEDGISVRCGVHTGEVQRDGRNITGMTVHIGARVGAAAGAGEVMVSRTVHDLVAGSGLGFSSRGEHELKGVPGSWELFVVGPSEEPPDGTLSGGSIQTPMDKVAVQAARRAPGLLRTAMRVANAVERRRAR